MPLKILLHVQSSKATPYAKTCHTTYKSVHPFFAQLTLLPIAQNPMLYNAFQLARHLRGIYIPT